MDMTAVRALALTVAMNTQGVDVAVTVPDENRAVSMRGLWIQTTDELMPVGRDFQRRDPRRLMQLPLASPLLDVPRGTLVVAPPPGSTTARTWRVENVDRAEADFIRVVVAPVD